MFFQRDDEDKTGNGAPLTVIFFYQAYVGWDWTHPLIPASTEFGKAPTCGNFVIDPTSTGAGSRQNRGFATACGPTIVRAAGLLRKPRPEARSAVNGASVSGPALKGMISSIISVLIARQWWPKGRKQLGRGRPHAVGRRKMHAKTVQQSDEQSDPVRRGDDDGSCTSQRCAQIDIGVQWQRVGRGAGSSKVEG